MVTKKQAMSPIMLSLTPHGLTNSRELVEILQKFGIGIVVKMY